MNTAASLQKQSEPLKSISVDEMMMNDSLTIEDFMSKGDGEIIITLVQKSPRHISRKKIALYLFKERAYWGNYEIHSEKEYSYTSIPNSLCVMIFGKPKERCQKELQQLIRKGRFSDKSKYYFIILFKIGFNKRHIIKHVTR